MTIYDEFKDKPADVVTSIWTYNMKIYFDIYLYYKTYYIIKIITQILFIWNNLFKNEVRFWLNYIPRM